MARIIPSFIDPHASSGERDVFNLLADGPSDWVVIHSLDVSPWNRGRRTEIDFLVIVPERGILCVEVKPQDSIAFDGVRWHPQEIRRSPIKQACDGSSTFHRALVQLAPRFSRTPVTHCCIFTNSVFELGPLISIQPWELMDARSFRLFRSSSSFCTDLRHRIEEAIRANRDLQMLEARIPPDQVEALVQLCVPVQKRRPDAREDIRRRAEAAERILREQQKLVLTIAQSNPRVIVSGAAGTGKTLISMEVARRAAERGRRTALLCFNQLVGDWMKERVCQMAPALPNLVVGRAIRVLAEMAEIQIPENASREFWDSGLPELLEAKLSDPDFSMSAGFDYLVLDEAQDILARPRLWECLAAFLVGGLEDGEFALFGDFANQVLGDREAMERTLAAVRAVSHPTMLPLSENCRNYKIVGETAVRLSGVSPSTYSAYLRSGGNVRDYEIEFYSDRRSQLERVKHWLAEFRELGYKPSEISILSFRDSASSAAAELVRQGFKLRPAWQRCDSTSFTSVAAFKGMENKIIVLTDVAPREASFYRELFYTGMTRATESVRVSCDVSSREVLVNWLTEGALR